jgi:hypothetical protein
MPGQQRTRTRWKHGWVDETGSYYDALSAPPQLTSLTRRMGTFTTMHDTVNNFTQDYLAILSNPRSRKARRRIYNANNLEIIDQYYRHGWFTAVKNSGTSSEKRWTRYPGLNPGTPESSYGSFNLATPSSRYNAILAGSNISTPQVSIPAFLGELPELPMAFRNFGRKQLANSGLPKQAAAANLGWRWGISPLLNDFRAFLAGLDDIQKRLMQLRKLRVDGYYSSTVQLSKQSYVGPKTSLLLYATGGLFVFAYKTTSYSVNEWGSAQWYVRPTTVLPPLMEEHNIDPLTWHLPVSDLRWAQARRLGLTPYEALAAAWELLPWSWLADWFFGVSNFINAWRNELSLGVRNVCLMRRYRSETTFDIRRDVSAPELGFCRPPLTRETRKLRFPVNGASFYDISTQPIFNPAKWGIIASLLALSQKSPLNVFEPGTLPQLSAELGFRPRRKRK